jgi:hypothetical protein
MKKDGYHFARNKNKTQQKMMIMQATGRGLGQPNPSSTSSRCRLTHARSEALVCLYILIQRSNETKKSTVDPHRDRGGQ